MTQFQLYFELGLDHILDLRGFDHMIFIIILCAIYLIRDWKNVIVLITAFTVGHSLTLALATFKVVNVNPAMVEFLIPATILITALSNIFKPEKYKSNRVIHLNYYLALFFGLIHGLGFSNNLRSLLGKDENILIQLLSFNLGIEVGQLAIVLVFLLISFLFVDLMNVNKRDWRLVISSFGGGIALLLMLQNNIW